jgi:hypothetical protein
MADIEVSRRSSPRYVVASNQRILLRDKKKVRDLQQYPPALAQPRFLPLALALVRLWLSCWYPEGFIIKSRRKQVKSPPRC